MSVEADLNQEAESLMRALDCADVFGHRDEIHAWFAARPEPACHCDECCIHVGIDVQRLAKALVASDLMRRYFEYARDAHEWTMAREPMVSLADKWAATIAREYTTGTPEP